MLDTTAAAMPAAAIPMVIKVTLEKALRDLSLPTRDMTDEELGTIAIKAKTSVESCDDVTSLVGNLNTAHRYILGAALEILKERHTAAQKLLPSLTVSCA